MVDFGEPITFGFSFVAIELGLSLTEDAASVFPVVLKGASHAATSYADHKQGKAESEALQSPPAGVSIH